jgi:hypothetical protein
MVNKQIQLKTLKTSVDQKQQAALLHPEREQAVSLENSEYNSSSTALGCTAALSTRTGRCACKPWVRSSTEKGMLHATATVKGTIANQHNTGTSKTSKTSIYRKQNYKTMCTSSAGGMSSPSFWSSMASGMPSILVAMTGRSKAMASQMQRGRTSFKEGWSTTSAAR